MVVKDTVYAFDELTPKRKLIVPKEKIGEVKC
jgi:hypothetical protein